MEALVVLAPSSEQSLPHIKTSSPFYKLWPQEQTLLDHTTLPGTLSNPGLSLQEGPIERQPPDKMTWTCLALGGVNPSAIKTLADKAEMLTGPTTRETSYWSRQESA